MRDMPGRPSRRGFLKGSAAGVAIASFAGTASAQAQEKEAPPPLDQYERVYLNDAEWAFVMAACARLIPSDGDGPGAIECRVPVFIDRQLAGDFGKASDWYMQGPFDPAATPTLGFQSPLTPAEIYRKAIPAFQDWCNKTHGGSFEALEPAKQDAALTSLQKGEVPLDPELRDFFSFLLANTKEGYFADPGYGGNHGMQAWVYIGFPGARGAFTSWPGRENAQYPLGPVAINGERA
ncbi:gluconate 2-dehydrogenase subunit 3 family protein [Rhizobium sp. NRK18]|uniref:gluconate 2-dehydrogenase subunit 3 family protein n=1 Tax=Rhizobium sp. NRK18 TaxID=2964667 RepID=UPI0021C376C1|nr:gluconate 2-dehydrogenase subunit 3 family protein [Rhizobium sp. NRK18]MCQ2006275.1 gluconate 2-dehydrogenase subunit 3 family protein [Rhizobium sp. NRK18]